MVFLLSSCCPVTTDDDMAHALTGTTRRVQRRRFASTSQGSSRDARLRAVDVAPGRDDLIDVVKRVIVKAQVHARQGIFQLFRGAWPDDDRGDRPVRTKGKAVQAGACSQHP